MTGRMKKNKGLLENKNKIRIGRVGGCVASRNWDSNPEKKLDLKGNWASPREDSPSTLREGKEKEEIDERNFFSFQQHLFTAPRHSA